MPTLAMMVRRKIFYSEFQCGIFQNMFQRHEVIAGI